MNTKKHAVKSSLAKRSFQRFLENKVASIGAVILFLIIFVCICVPLITSKDPNFIDVANTRKPFSSENWLGTDLLGRDIFARLLYGGRMSIMIGVGSAVGATLLGTALGCIAGYYGKKVDKVLVYVCELFMCFPQYLLILLCVGLLGQSTGNLLIIFIGTGWAGIMRIVRGRIQSLKEEPFVESCRANGIRSTSIMFHHLLPNTRGPVIVNMTLQVSGYILAEAGLSFLGMGVPSTVVTWGNIINAAKRLDLIQNTPALWLAPGIAICLLILSINFFGDGLRDALDHST